MTSGWSEAEPPTADGVTDEASDEAWTDVRDYLTAHPNRLRDDKDLLATLGLKYAPANVVEFLPAALARMEAAHARETSARQEIETLAKANFDAQAKTHDLIINLLESRSNTDLVRRINRAAQEQFGLAGAMIAVETPPECPPAPLGWKSLPAGVTDLLMGGDRESRVGPCHAARELFEGDTPILSCALVRIRLWRAERPGVLGFGAAAPDTFTPEMGAELVSFLARVVERTAARWPNL